MRLSSRLLRQIAGCLVVSSLVACAETSVARAQQADSVPRDSHNRGLPMVPRRHRTQTLLLPKPHPIARRLLRRNHRLSPRTGWHRGRSA